MLPREKEGSGTTELTWDRMKMDGDGGDETDDAALHCVAIGPDDGDAEEEPATSSSLERTKIKPNLIPSAIKLGNAHLR